jgi:hypothetical protein
VAGVHLEASFARPVPALTSRWIEGQLPCRVSTIAEIQEAIVHLSEAEREELRLWLDAYEEDDWDRQITADAASGKLDFLHEQAQAAKRAGRRELLPGGA